MDEELLKKQAPQSLEAEQAVLGSVLIDSRCITDVVGLLKPDDFYLKQNREIFAAIDTGYVSQNIYLAATARNLGTCAMGSIADRKILQEKLALQNNKIMLVHPLGTPAK